MDRPDVYIGIDSSLVGHAVSAVDAGRNIITVKGWTDRKSVAKKFPEWMNHYKMEQNTDLNRLIRINHMFCWTRDLIDSIRQNGRVAVAIEGYAFSRAHLASSDLHELGGLLKNWLLKTNIPFRIYQPTAVKKAWTGSGNADKAQMQMACFNATGVDFTQVSGAGDGLADATLLALMLCLEIRTRLGDFDRKTISRDMWEVFNRKSKQEDSLLSRELIGIDAACYNC